MKLNSEQKVALLKIYATAECEYDAISFIKEAQSKTKFVFEEELARLRKLRDEHPDVFNRPAKEPIHKVRLNDRQKKQVKKALKTGELNPDSIEWAWLPNCPGSKCLSPSEYLALLEDTLLD